MSNTKRQYKRMMRKYKKELKKILKETGPWEWGHMTDYMITFIKWMRDYYKLGYNVMAMEDCDAFPEDAGKPTRLESLNMAIQLYNKWQDCDNEYFILVDNDLVETMQEGGYHYTKDGNKELHPDQTYMFKGETFSEAVSAFNIEYKRRKAEFFEYLCEHLEEWWD